MRNFQIHVDIQAPPDLVWSVMRDVERWPEWAPTVTKVRLTRCGPIAPGCRAIVHQPKLPPALWRVTELDDARRSFTWTSGGPGLRVIARHGVEVSGAGSRAMLSIRFDGLLGGLLGRALRDLNHRYLAMEAAGLKRRSETPPS